MMLVERSRVQEKLCDFQPQRNRGCDSAPFTANDADWSGYTLTNFNEMEQN